MRSGIQNKPYTISRISSKLSPITLPLSLLWSDITVLDLMTSWHRNDFRITDKQPRYPWWRHQMETLSALLAICAGNSPIPVNSPHKGQWRGTLMFSLICTRINGWVNNRDAGDLRRRRAHYDVIVMPVIWDAMTFMSLLGRRHGPLG